MPLQLQLHYSFLDTHYYNGCGFSLHASSLPMNPRCLPRICSRRHSPSSLSPSGILHSMLSISRFVASSLLLYAFYLKTFHALDVVLVYLHCLSPNSNRMIAIAYSLFVVTLPRMH